MSARPVKSAFKEWLVHSGGRAPFSAQARSAGQPNPFARAFLINKPTRCSACTHTTSNAARSRERDHLRTTYTVSAKKAGQVEGKRQQRKKQEQRNRGAQRRAAGADLPPSRQPTSRTKVPASTVGRSVAQVTRAPRAHRKLLPPALAHKTHTKARSARGNDLGQLSQDDDDNDHVE